MSHGRGVEHGADVRPTAGAEAVHVVEDERDKREIEKSNAGLLSLRVDD